MKNLLLTACVLILGVSILSGHRRNEDDIFGLVAQTVDHIVSLEDSYTSHAAAVACAQDPSQRACRSEFRPAPGTWVIVSPSLLHGVPRHFFASLADAVAPIPRAAELTTTSALVLPVQNRSGDLASPPVTLAADVVTYGASFQFSAGQMAATGWGMTAWVEESTDGFVNDVRLECGQTLDGPIPPGALVFFHCSNSGTGNPLRGRVVTCSQVSLMQRQPLTCAPATINVGVTVESQS